jgi:hypothetical protein
VIRPNLEVRSYLPSTKFLYRMFSGGNTSAWEKFSRVGRTMWYGHTYDFSQIYQDNHYKRSGARPITKIKIGQPGSQKLAWGDPNFNQGRYVHPNYSFTSCLSLLNKRNICFNLVLEILFIPSLWKWWMVAKLKLCKNLVHIFVLYAFLNLLVYFETRAWNKTLWEENAYDQI